MLHPQLIFNNYYDTIYNTFYNVSYKIELSYVNKRLIKSITLFFFYREQQNREHGPNFGRKIENFLYITPKMCRPAFRIAVLYKKNKVYHANRMLG